MTDHTRNGPDSATRIAQDAMDAIARFLRTATHDARSSDAALDLLDAANALGGRLRRVTQSSSPRRLAAEPRQVEIPAHMQPPAAVSGLPLCRIVPAGDPHGSPAAWVLADDQSGTILEQLANTSPEHSWAAPTGANLNAIVAVMEAHGLLSEMQGKVRRRARQFAHAILALQRQA
ncbi:hypothetical protein [Cupriavidus numazuensis]|uniref:Uncharacterized protein n=1 Tax=Cupriavidus numazuensis TaxID=221992 RepID=A0ABN7QBF6_9BURK|nr:hypothetical protein [Cupriavidus numazuensis]CAG2159730.1 hypothetical protein LMG26411_06934 [Cupriavidus numazuensis]